MDRQVMWRLHGILLYRSAGEKWSSWQHVAMGIILLLAVALNFFRLDQLGYGNIYYAAAASGFYRSAGSLLADEIPLAAGSAAAGASPLGNLVFNGERVLLCGRIFPYLLSGDAGPAICALVGIGVVALLQEYLRAERSSWLFPGALLFTGGIQGILLIPYPAYSQFLLPAVIVLSLLAMLLLGLVTCVVRLRVPIMLTCGVSLGLLALFLSPMLWSALSVLHNGDMLIPRAGPAAVSAQSAAPDPHTNAELRRERQRLIQYLLLHRGKTRFLLATPDSLMAAPIMLETGKPVMALGGFLGIDPILTPEKLSALVADGEVHYFLLPYFKISQLPAQIRVALAQKDFASFGIARSLVALLSWVYANCQPVPDQFWSIQATSVPRHTAGNLARASSQVQFSFAGVTERLYSCSRPHR